MHTIIQYIKVDPFFQKYYTHIGQIRFFVFLSFFMDKKRRGN